MRFADLLGQERNVRLLKAALVRDRVAHAYLLTGPPGSGKRSMAEVFAAALDCEARGPEWDGEPCGECRSCRKVAHGNHPDVQVIAPEGAHLKLEQMQELRRENARRPYEARYKVFIVDRAEAMTDEAANCLLKTLEEPPGPAVFLLLTAYPARILPTIASRCSILKMASLPEALIARALMEEGRPEEQARAAAALAGGSLGRAREVAGRWETLREEAREFYAAACRGDRVALLNRAAAWSKSREEAQERLELLEALYRQLLLEAGGSPPGVWRRVLGPAEDGGGLSLAGARTVLEAVMWAQRALSANAHRRLLLEVLFLEIARCHTGGDSLPGLAEEPA
ncbi:MAG: DNA polymerase III subunit delta' [Bacillota bacterium]|nr:DNA polymerase III subunit delta' [Bacillota bacterium]